MSSAILIIAGAYAGYKCVNRFIIMPRRMKMNLKKYNNSDKVKIVEVPEGLYAPVTDDELALNPVYAKVYETFGRKIESEIPREDLDHYYRNFATLKEAQTPTKYFFKRLLEGNIVGATYQADKNAVDFETLPLFKYMGTINHELLHAATTYYDRENNIVYCGFEQVFVNKDDKKKNEAYGIGINEGYTQYLNNKLFPNGVAGKLIYPEQQTIAKALEYVVGEEKMRSLYFRADFKGLADILEQYVSREELYRFINVTDVMCAMGRMAHIRIPEVKEAEKFVDEFLLKLIVKAKGITAKNMTYEQYEQFKEFIPYKKVKGITVNISSEPKEEEVSMGSK